MRLALAICLCAMALGACTSPVKLYNARTGQAVQCGPYASDMVTGTNAYAVREAQCIQDFQRQGYERMP
jgi:hypothetical protein